jgi:hypothetical protein
MMKKSVVLLLLLPLIACGKKGGLKTADPASASAARSITGNDETGEYIIAARSLDTTGFRGYGVAYNDSVLSGDIYVDASAPAGGDGSAGAPFRTIEAGLNAAYAGGGDTVVVLAGTYAETVIPGANVVLTNFRKQTVRVSGNPSGTLYLSKVVDEHDIIIQGIDFSPTRVWHSAGWKEGPYHIEITGSRWITFRYCNFQRLTEDITKTKSEFIRGVHVGTSEHVTFRGNYFKGWSHSLVLEPQASDTSFFLIKNNHLAQQSWCGIIFGAATPGADFGTPAVLVEGNLIENSWGEDGIQWQPDYQSGAALQKVPKHFKYLVRNNVFRDCAENAVDLKAVGHAMFEQNYFYRISGVDDGWFGGVSPSGGAFEVGAGDSSRNAIIRFNVFYDNSGSTGSRMWPGWKLFHNTMVYNKRGKNGPGTNACANIQHYNNLPPANAIKNNIDINSFVAVQSSAHTSYLDVDYNIYHSTSGNPRFLHYTKAWTAITGLQRWKAHWDPRVLGRDVHSRSGDPHLSKVPAYPSGNHTSYNFMPAAGSIAVDAAGPLTLATNEATGTKLVVADAYYFRDAWGMSAFGVVGDSIVVGAQDPTGITAIDYTTNAITLSGPRTWRTGASVYLFRNGKKVDDIGAMQR